MSLISRDPLEIVSHAIGPHHQYPDGLMLSGNDVFPYQGPLHPGRGLHSYDR